MYIYTADGHHISHVERDRVTEGLLRYIVHLFVGVTRFVMLLYVCGGVFWWMRGKRRAWGQDLRNYNSRSKVKINQVPGGTFLKRSGPLARIKIKGKSHNVWWTICMHNFNFYLMNDQNLHKVHVLLSRKRIHYQVFLYLINVNNFFLIFQKTNSKLL